MSVFDDVNQTTNKASDIGERYIKTSHQYFRLKIFQQLTLSFSMIVKAVIVGTLSYLALLFFSIALVVVLSNALDSIVVGCLIVGLIYLVLALIMYMLRSKINKFVIRKIGSKFFK